MSACNIYGGNFDWTLLEMARCFSSQRKGGEDSREQAHELKDIHFPDIQRNFSEVGEATIVKTTFKRALYQEVEKNIYSLLGVFC